MPNIVVLEEIASPRARLVARAAHVLRNPGNFALRVVRTFRKNQGLLLAGSVAYYSLLSLIPFLILMLIALSPVIDQSRLLATMTEYLEFIVPGQSAALVTELHAFVDRGQIIGGVLLVTMIFFSALATHDITIFGVPHSTATAAPKSPDGEAA